MTSIYHWLNETLQEEVLDQSRVMHEEATRTMIWKELIWDMGIQLEHTMCDEIVRCVKGE